MTPAVSAGDHVVMEGMTYLARRPRRGDVVVFRTDGIFSLPPAQIYIKRVAGEPGDQLRISDGKLYVNGKHVAITNATGEIAYQMPTLAATRNMNTDTTVPDGCYFVLGDTRQIVWTVAFGAACHARTLSAVCAFVIGLWQELEQ